MQYWNAIRLLEIDGKTWQLGIAEMTFSLLSIKISDW
jgi:hypothetical protein